MAKPRGTSVKNKWWWNEDAKEWERAGWEVTCAHGDLQRLCRTLDEVRAVRDAHPAECVQQRLFA